MRAARASLAALLIAMIVAPSALAAGLQITTPFPSVVADPGSTARFNVVVATDTPQRVDLTVVSQPEGWTTRLRGGGSTIAAVYTATDPTLAASEPFATFSAEVDIPDDAVPSSNQIVLEGRSADGQTTRLALDITIEMVAAGSITLESSFPSQNGSADKTFSFDLQVHNGSNQQVTLNYEVDAPVGWNAGARPGGSSNATTAVIDAGGTSTVTVTLSSPTNAPAGIYPITARAIGGPAPAEIELSVEITGNYAMSMTTEDSRLSARVTAGSPTEMVVVLVNEGSAPLENVALTATPPRNWTVAFEAETIPVIPAGEQVSVRVTITTAGNAIAGDYVVSMRARTDQANDSIDVRTTVETSPVGGLLGLAVLAAIAIGLFFVFQRYGRR